MAGEARRDLISAAGSRAVPQAIRPIADLGQTRH